MSWLRLLALCAIAGACGIYALRDQAKIELVITVVTAVCSVLVLVWQAVWQLVFGGDQRRTDPPLDVAEIVAAAQRRQWRPEVARRALTGSRLPVHWRLAAGTTADDLHSRPDPGLGPPPVPGVPAVDRLALEGNLDDLFQLYRTVARGRLVIEGGAGAGKTSVLLLLLMRALDLAPQRPVPVLLQLADWSATRSGLIRFATETLARDIPALRASDVLEQVAQAIEGGEICLFLDGFDQLAEADQVKVIACVNEEPSIRIVMASRPDEYERAQAAGSSSQELFGAVAIELLPIGEAEALAYLGRTGDDEVWRRVAARFTDAEQSPGPRLSNPLYLSLAALNYRGSSPAELLNEDRYPDAEAIAKRLIRGVVPQAYRGRGSWSVEQAQRWLQFVAQRMTHEPSGERSTTVQTQLAWSRIGEWPPLWLQRLVYGTYIGVLVAAGTWLALAGSSQAYPRQVSPWAPIAWGVSAGVAYVFTLVLDHKLTGEWAVGVAIGLGGGVCLGLMAGLLLSLELAKRNGEATRSSLIGLGAGSVVAVVLALVMVVVGFRNPATRARRRWPSSLAIGRPSWFVSLVLGLLAVLFLSALERKTAKDWALVGACFVMGVIAQAMTSGQASEHATDSARRSLRRDVAAWVSVGVFLGGCGALLFGAAFNTRPIYLPLWFLMYFSIAVLSSHTSGYLLAVSYFWLNDNLPRTPLRFLEDAREREVMRTVGWHYEFKHQVLLEDLAHPGGSEHRAAVEPPPTSRSDEDAIVLPIDVDKTP